MPHDAGPPAGTGPRSAGEAAPPVPPWRPVPKGRHPRKPPLTREAIVTVALEIIDAEGLEALSMRRIAQRLDTGAASLYAHVTGKEELLELVVDRVNGEAVIPEADPRHWRAQAHEAMRSIRDVYARHRDLGRALLGRVPVGPNSVVAAERLLAILRAGGLPPKVMSFAVDLMSLYAVTAGLETGAATSPHGGADQDKQDYYRQVGDYFAALPPERFPTIRWMGDAMTSGDGDERFAFGVEVLLLGLTAYAAREG